ncbi:Seven in absentia protein family [Popillia japonica]|uniref:Seven in absentia protein family n=1 Tax=Popillia japonica TaxID=7064 RepID=A0AAW1MRR6_POPJA
MRRSGEHMNPYSHNLLPRLEHYQCDLRQISVRVIVPFKRQENKMVINILETKDLLELSLLKCKICCRRLQSPILQVSGFDNVCGSCTSDSNAKRNVDLEALLEKLYLPCNYAESGCKFEGNFDDVCIHEKVCCFQELKCPLAPYGQCNGDLDNIVEHIESKHPDNVLKVVANHVYVRNPNAEKTTAIYLFAVDNLRFVLSAKLDAKKDQISYAFYCLNYDVNMDDVKISIPLKDDNLNCNVEIIHVKQLGKGEVPSMFYEKNVIKMKCIILEIFGCSDTITIRIDITKSVALIEETDELCNSFAGSWTHRIVCCEKCFKGDYHFHCSCSPNNSMSNSKTHTESITIHSVLNLDSFKPNRTLQCGNTGCNKEIYGLRLQSPILQVSGFDNVCGSCTSDSNAKRNVDLEALLEKLYLPCNYAESGCKFEGNFDDVCIHEKVCCFQELKCPLAPYGQCNGDLDNIVEHIESKHPDNVLKVVANHVYVRNPNAEKTTAIYLFAVDNLRFVLSAKLDAKKDQISYAFYCLNYDVNMDDVKISIPLKDDNLNCNVEIIHVKQLGKGEVPSMFYEKNVIKMKCIILEIFGCSDTITIRIDITKSVALVEETDELCNSFAGSWYKCSFCSKAAKNIHYCNRTHRIVCCEKCFKVIVPVIMVKCCCVRGCGNSDKTVSKRCFPYLNREFGISSESIGD